MECISEKLFSEQNLPLIEIPLMDVMDSRRALHHGIFVLIYVRAEPAEQHVLELNQQDSEFVFTFASTLENSTVTLTERYKV